MAYEEEQKTYLRALVARGKPFETDKDRFAFNRGVYEQMGQTPVESSLTGVIANLYIRITGSGIITRWAKSSPDLALLWKEAVRVYQNKEQAELNTENQVPEEPFQEVKTEDSVPDAGNLQERLEEVVKETNTPNTPNTRPPKRKSTIQTPPSPTPKLAKKSPMVPKEPERVIPKEKISHDPKLLLEEQKQNTERLVQENQEMLIKQTRQEELLLKQQSDIDELKRMISTLTSGLLMRSFGAPAPATPFGNQTDSETHNFQSQYLLSTRQRRNCA